MADWLDSARPMRIATLRDSALDAGDWVTASLALLADPASQQLPQIALDLLGDIAFGHREPTALDIRKIQSIANVIAPIGVLP